MNAYSVHQSSKMIQSLCLEGKSWNKKQNNHRLECLDLALNNRILNLINTSNYSFVRKEHTLEKQVLLNKWVRNIGLSISSIGAGLFLDFNKKVNAWTVGVEILNSTNFCFSSIFPNGTSEFFKKYVNYPNWLSVTKDNFNCRMGVVYGPVFEELVDRVLLQEVLLKRVPEKILQRVSPQYSHLINHSAAKITRIFLTSVFFALHHYWAHTCSHGDMYPYLLAGATLGVLQEVSGHPFYSIVAHMIANASNYKCMDLNDLILNKKIMSY